MGVLCVLPARLRSDRLPSKLLKVVADRPLIEWSWRAAGRIGAFDAVWVATDSEEILDRVRAFGAEAVMTAPDHPSGTDRVAEAARRPAAQGFDVLVNYQADEPFTDPRAVRMAVQAVRDGATSIATVAAPIRTEAEWRDEAVVKVVVANDARALYFSRAPIPHPRGGVPSFDAEVSPKYLRHVGVYVYRRAALERWVSLEPTGLERIEKLEQLRALQAGLDIHVVVGPPTEPGIDVPGDLERAERLLTASHG